MTLPAITLNTMELEEEEWIYGRMEKRNTIDGIRYDSPRSMLTPPPQTVSSTPS